ncbi:hypothetical protein AMS62_22815 [Bacillus sp. FJAT-18019]|nr:hypothetical protein AMS62_22815 [Bacillus sp. FJAT-18019]
MSFVCELHILESQDVSFQLGNAHNEQVEVRYIADERKVVLSREQIGHSIQGREADYPEFREYISHEAGDSKLVLIVDTSSIEVIVNEGRGS